MISVLLYTKNKDAMTKVMAEQLELLGFQTEQTSVLNVPRLILNSYQIIHFIIPALPLSWNEVLCMTAAKALGKAVVLSVLDAPPATSLQNLSWNNPDALTVSQTNYLKLFRSKTGNKMIIPSLFENQFIKTEPVAQVSAITGFVFPLHKDLHEGLQLETDKPVYFDGRKLAEGTSSSQLRKQWNELLVQNRIRPTYELILSDEKMQILLSSSSLGLLVASENLSHSEFTTWFEIALKNNHLLVLNQFQATGFSNHWTSGQNCLVTTSVNWVKELNNHMNDDVFKTAFSNKSISQSSLDSLFNDLSRLYLKIIYQKTSLIDSGSAKI